MSTMRKRYVATYFYPGFLFPETTSADVEGTAIGDVVAAQTDARWYAAEVHEVTEEIFESDAYGETAVMRERVKVASFIVGTVHHYDSLPADQAILRSNIEVNDRSGGYGVLTRCGNWQIRSDWMTVVSPDDPAV